MRWREFFIPTTKEIPRDATAPSHQFMVRAGLIRQLAAGLYSYLPLGYRVLRKVEAIVREEMNRAGAIELHMPALQPLAMWERTGRDAAMGDVLLRLHGKSDDWRAQLVLGPTHEEVVTEIAQAYINSYKQLPVTLYQIQTKFRGEARPKSGVLRTREFLMKDAYSFHADKASLDESYQRMYDAYCRIFSRCGLPYVPVEAESGPIGGDASHEFMVVTDAGEDMIVVSENGDYAANLERAARMPSQVAPKPASETTVSKVHTPGLKSVEAVASALNARPDRVIKALMYEFSDVPDDERARFNSTVVRLHRESGLSLSKAIQTACGAGALHHQFLVCVRGDHEVNENKLRRVIREHLNSPVSQINLFDPELAVAGGVPMGFVGPHYVNIDSGFMLVIDPDALAVTDGIVGANEVDHHMTGFDWQRDVGRLLQRAVVDDIRNVVAGDFSPTGSGSKLRLKTAIEVGHVFKLGDKYSRAMDATFLTSEGKPAHFVMGCYGIGLNRIVAAAIEAHHDENGIIWPLAIAPFQALVIALDPRDERVMQLANQIHDQLAASGLDVLLDDRDERAGFKFKDADLIGIPLRIVIGKKSLEQGGVEATVRGRTEKELAPADSAIDWITSRAMQASPIGR